VICKKQARWVDISEHFDCHPERAGMWAISIEARLCNHSRCWISASFGPFPATAAAATKVDVTPNLLIRLGTERCKSDCMLSEPISPWINQSSKTGLQESLIRLLAKRWLPLVMPSLRSSMWQT